MPATTCTEQTLSISGRGAAWLTGSRSRCRMADGSRSIAMPSLLPSLRAHDRAAIARLIELKPAPANGMALRITELGYEVLSCLPCAPEQRSLALPPFTPL
jgi:hypothetical protein